MADVVLVDTTVKEPKEMKDIRISLRELLIDIRKGKSIGAISAENLPGLMAAVEGYEQLGDEAKTAESNNSIGLMSGDISYAIRTPKEELVENRN